MSTIPELLTDRLIFRSFECHRENTDKIGNTMFYRFFNEWWGVAEVSVNGIIYKVCRDSYNGVVELREVISNE